MVDKLRFAFAILFLAVGVAGFYLLHQQAMIFRVLAVLGGGALAVATAWYTEPGQRFFGFARESVVEVKKVVWPSRKETLQTTGVVFAFACFMALFLWLTDKALEVLVYGIILRRP